IPVGTSTVASLAEAAQLASLADETPEGRSIVVLAKQQHGLRGRSLHDADGRDAQFIPFTAQTRMSGCDHAGRQIRKGAIDAIENHVRSLGGDVPPELVPIANGIGDKGGTPLAVSDGPRVLG